MTYQPIDSIPYLHILMVLLLIAMVGVCIAALYSPNKFTIGLIVAFTLASVALTVHMDYNVRPEAKKTAEANLIQKYDVKQVLWDNDETTAGPASDGGEEIVVEVQDGTQYVFRYAVNKDTYEPTLSNLPIRGGNASDKVVNADDLLKTKTSS